MRSTAEAAKRAKDARRRRREMAAGTFLPGLVDADPVRAHLRYLSAHAIGYGQVSALTGVAYKTVARILYGEPRRGIPPTVKIIRCTAETLLAVQPSLDAVANNALVDATGTRRRLQALMAAGWPVTQIAHRLAVKRQSIPEFMNKPRIRAATARMVRDLYSQLADELPHGSNAGITRAQRRGSRNGWAPPIAWDDDTIDNPDAEPAHTAADTDFIDEMTVELVLERVGKPPRPDDLARATRLTAAEVDAVIVRLRGAGHTFHPIAELLGLTPAAASYRYKKAIRGAA